MQHDPYAAMVGGMFLQFIGYLILFFIMAFITRWIFRIGAIINRLDKLIALSEQAKVEEKLP